MLTKKIVSIVMDGYIGAVHMMHIDHCLVGGFKYKFIGKYNDVVGDKYSVYRSESGVLYYDNIYN